MKSIKITLTPEQRIQLAHAATLEIDLPDYDQVCAERDNAWRELRDIRKAINANPEESTFDECARIANQLNSAKTTLAAITSLLNQNGYTGMSLPDLLQHKLAEAACDGFQAGFDASSEGFNGEYGCFTDKSVKSLMHKRDNWLAENGYKKAP
jgi:hypothetical protein